MVFNEENYPNMVGLFQELGVEGENTDMSFSVSLDDGAVEWGSKGISSLFARKRNAFSWGFHSMLREMTRFNREAPRLLLLEDDDPRKAVSVREYLKTHGFSESFARFYLVPMAAALWSASAADVMNHSALAMISFFHNHQMLQVFGRPQWKTPASRSRQYVTEICRRIGEDKIELETACVSVKKLSPEMAATTAGWEVVDSKGASRVFDEVCTGTTTREHVCSEGGGWGGRRVAQTSSSFEQYWGVGCSSYRRQHVVPRNMGGVIFACPAPTALRIVGEEASCEERAALERFECSENIVYVHSDEKLMPSRRSAWSAWNYMGTSPEIQAAAAKGQKAQAKPVFVTYWLNKLQNLPGTRQIFVSLNPSPLPEASAVHKKLVYGHPQFSPSAEKGQRLLSGIDGRRGLWFCGAWRGYGFHEDGLRSGLEAATGITGKPVPWATQKQAGGTPEISPKSRASPLIQSNPEVASTPTSNGHASLVGQGLVLPQPRIVVGGKGLYERVWGWASALVEAICVRAIVSFLRRTVVKGCMTIVCPDGTTYTFGDDANTTHVVNDGDSTATNEGRRISIKVFDWSFFVRVAMEYDLGLARSYMAGEWELIGDNAEHDGLRQLFLFFVDNRDVSDDGKNGGMKAGKLLTSWVGYGLNYLRYKFTMDNSLSGSRSNIEAHYDLSNDLFKIFLDKNLMLYSSGVFQADMG
ncbi:unnamed protein product, partial [Sphacelaria rigidula]